MSYFATNFNFSTDDTVAIMGVHDGGRALTNNSGFQVHRLSLPDNNLSELYSAYILENTPFHREGRVGGQNMKKVENVREKNRKRTANS
jgi:hypothetical protein